MTDMLCCAYRAGGLLDPCLDSEGSGADVLKAEVLCRGFGVGPFAEFTDPSGLGGVHELNRSGPDHPGLMNLHVPVKKLLFTKVLQPLWFNEGGSAAHCAIADGASFIKVPWSTGAQMQLLSGQQENREI